MNEIESERESLGEELGWDQGRMGGEGDFLNAEKEEVQVVVVG